MDIKSGIPPFTAANAELTPAAAAALASAESSPAAAAAAAAAALKLEVVDMRTNTTIKSIIVPRPAMAGANLKPTLATSAMVLTRPPPLSPSASKLTPAAAAALISSSPPVVSADEEPEWFSVQLADLAAPPAGRIIPLHSVSVIYVVSVDMRHPDAPQFLKTNEKILTRGEARGNVLDLILTDPSDVDGRFKSWQMNWPSPCIVRLQNIDVNSDPFNCGYIGCACQSGQFCIDGSCMEPRQMTQVQLSSIGLKRVETYVRVGREKKVT